MISFGLKLAKVGQERPRQVLVVHRLVVGDLFTLERRLRASGARWARRRWLLAWARGRRRARRTHRWHHLGFENVEVLVALGDLGPRDALGQRRAARSPHRFRRGVAPAGHGLGHTTSLGPLDFAERPLVHRGGPPHNQGDSHNGQHDQGDVGFAQRLHHRVDGFHCGFHCHGYSYSWLGFCICINKTLYFL